MRARWLLGVAALAGLGAAPVPAFDVIVSGGTVYDGDGGPGIRASVAIKGDRIVAVAPRLRGEARRTIDATGKAVAPGFINMLAHPEESLFEDGRALSDLVQGVTLEVMGEFSMGPLTPPMAAEVVRRQSDVRFPVTWTTLGGYLDTLERRGVSPNIASFVGAGEVRTAVLGPTSAQPNPEQLTRMRGLVRAAMREGALGVTTALIYAPNTFAGEAELTALATEAARCGGIYSAHMRSEGDRLLEAIAETVRISEASGAPAHIYHWKQAGRDNWGKRAAAVAAVEAARARGVKVDADMYTYTAGATGLDAAMPTWVQDGGYAAWAARLRDPAVRARVAAEMRERHPKGWENLAMAAGPEAMLLLSFKNPALKPLTGRTMAAVAAERGKPWEEVAMDLVVEDGSRVGVAYFLMSEANVRANVALPWMSFGSDEEAPAPAGVFLRSRHHPRAYGNFARVFAEYVRGGVLSVGEAVRRLSALPADTLGLRDRGRLRAGAYADVVVFDPAAVSAPATYDRPDQLAGGVSWVLVNGGVALAEGRATGAATGRVVRGRGWTGGGGGGCDRVPIRRQ